MQQKALSFLYIADRRVISFEFLKIKKYNYESYR